MNIYKAIAFLGSILELKNKDPKIVKIAIEEINSITDDVINPEFSDLNLSIRKKSISIVGIQISLIGIYISFSLALLGLLNASGVIFHSIAFLSFNLIASGLFILCFRYPIAARDHSRFLKDPGNPNFKINKLAHSTWFDLLSGVPIATLIIYDVLSR